MLKMQDRDTHSNYFVSSISEEKMFSHSHLVLAQRPAQGKSCKVKNQLIFKGIILYSILQLQRVNIIAWSWMMPCEVQSLSSLHSYTRHAG